jgi:NitT/TauT family transport system substrate-binding protein
MLPYAPNTGAAELRELAASFAGSWSVNGGLDAADLQYTQDWLYSTEDFAAVAPVTLAQWVDFAPLDAILAELGTVDGEARGH